MIKGDSAATYHNQRVEQPAIHEGSPRRTQRTQNEAADRGISFDEICEVVQEMSASGEGKLKEAELKCSVYKRAIENTYKLKTESGRKLLAVVEQNFHTFPFSFNSFDDETNLKMKQKFHDFEPIKDEARKSKFEDLDNAGEAFLEMKLHRKFDGQL